MAGEIGAPSWAEISFAPPWAEIDAPQLQQRRGLEKMGEKRREKGEREKVDHGKKKKKKLKRMGRLIFFYSMKRYNSFLFVKNYCNNLAI